MLGRYFYALRFSRDGSRVRCWWNGVRYRWAITNKAPWIAVLAVGLVFAAFGFLIRGLFAAKDDHRALTCLALNVYFEARGEPVAGQRAVAEVTMNRVASKRYPRTVCGVVYQKTWDPLRKRHVGAFSWTEFDSVPPPKGREWQRAWEVAEAVYYRREPPKLPAALHYHATSIRPSWAEGREPLARIGSHVFYR